MKRNAVNHLQGKGLVAPEKVSSWYIATYIHDRRVYKTFEEESYAKWLERKWR